MGSAPEMYDVVVVGAGGTMGSSAMYHLASQGAKVMRSLADYSCIMSYTSCIGWLGLVLRP